MLLLLVFSAIGNMAERESAPELLSVDEFWEERERERAEERRQETVPLFAPGSLEALNACRDELAPLLGRQRGMMLAARATEAAIAGWTDQDRVSLLCANISGLLDDITLAANQWNGDVIPKLDECRQIACAMPDLSECDGFSEAWDVRHDAIQPYADRVRELRGQFVQNSMAERCQPSGTVFDWPDVEGWGLP